MVVRTSESCSSKHTHTHTASQSVLDTHKHSSSIYSVIYVPQKGACQYSARARGCGKHSSIYMYIQSTLTDLCASATHQHHRRRRRLCVASSVVQVAVVVVVVVVACRRRALRLIERAYCSVWCVPAATTTTNSHPAIPASKHTQTHRRKHSPRNVYSTR